MVLLKLCGGLTFLQFKDIQFAYEVLSDPEKREKYDHFGMAAVKGEDAGGASK